MKKLVPSRILVHDYCGHPFPTQLSRKLASRGHDVLHVSSQSVVTPQGTLAKLEGDSPSLRFSGIRLSKVIDRQAFLQRYFQERAYGRLLAKEIGRFQPDVVVSGNTPLEAQNLALLASRSSNSRFVFWLQDIHGIAIERLLGARLGLVGRLIGRHYTRVEQRLLRASDAVVAISEDFSNVLSAWGVDAQRIALIPNWASTAELPERPKDTAWARAHGLADKFCFLYSGTLGMKHNPDLLLQLGLRYRDDPSVAVVVVSEGAGAQWLNRRRLELNLSGLKILPFQPYADLPDVLGSADVLVAILEPDAGVFSVPSKVLSYLCAGRALLLAVPLENLSARTVMRAGAGVVAAPGDLLAYLREADALKSDAARRTEMGQNALRYARENFDIDRTTDRFEAVFEAALSGHAASA
jgi:glycosyltransferase involved in cell wall biosynthesis